MAISVTNQAYIFLWAVAGGIIAGLLFDFFRCIRRISPRARRNIQIQDIIFWLLITILVSIGLFTVNNGELRGFEFLGLALGWIFYALTISRACSIAIQGLLKIIITVSLFVVKILILPIALIYKIAKPPVRFLLKLGRSCGKVCIKLARYVILDIKKLKFRIKKV